MGSSSASLIAYQLAIIFSTFSMRVADISAAHLVRESKVLS